jgi:hypothetical protein
MSTLGIHHPELYRRSGGQEEKGAEWEEDNETVNTTNSSVTFQRSNVSEFGMANNARASVDAFLQEFGPAMVSAILSLDTLAVTVRARSQRDQRDISILSNEAINEQAREFLQQLPQNVIAGDEDSKESSLTSSVVDDGGSSLMNQSVGTFALSASTGGTDENSYGSVPDSVQNLEPLPIGNEGAPAVSPPHSPVLSAAPGAATTTATGDGMAVTQTTGNGQDEEKKPSAKKQRKE